MTRAYKYGDTTQITEHFKASEFRMIILFRMNW